MADGLASLLKIPGVAARWSLLSGTGAGQAVSVLRAPSSGFTGATKAVRIMVNSEPGQRSNLIMVPERERQMRCVRCVIPIFACAVLIACSSVEPPKIKPPGEGPSRMEPFTVEPSQTQPPEGEQSRTGPQGCRQGQECPQEKRARRPVPQQPVPPISPLPPMPPAAQPKPPSVQSPAAPPAPAAVGPSPPAPVTICDANGCWNSDAGRYSGGAAAGTYLDKSGRLCQRQGIWVQCY